MSKSCTISLHDALPIYNGPDSFSYTVTSPAGVTETATVSVTVNAVADITADSVTSREDVHLVFVGDCRLAVGSSERSPVVSSVGTAAHGTVSLSGGNITYRAKDRKNGVEGKSVKVSRPAGVNKKKTGRVTVNAVADNKADSEKGTEDVDLGVAEGDLL